MAPGWGWGGVVVVVRRGGNGGSGGAGVCVYGAAIASMGHFSEWW